jgi:carboxylesterase
MIHSIIPTAEPFFFPGGSTGVLLVHGFTGAPKEMRWMGKYLAQKGFSVLGVRLAGHATRPDDMVTVRWQDWLTSVEDGYHLLKGSTSKIVVAGLSLGGVLALVFASHFEVAGAIAMSTIYELPPDPRLRFIRLLQWIQPQVPKGESDWKDPLPESDHIDYPYYPTKAIIQVQGLLAELKDSLPHITAPCLLMHSSQDGSVPPDHMEKIFAQLGTSDKEMFLIENSGHVIVRDLEKDKVFQTAEQFIRRVTGENQ